MRKTLEEWLDDNEYNLSFLEIPYELNEVDLKSSLTIKYGNKNMLSIYDNVDGREVINHLNNMFSEKWEWLVKFTLDTYEVGETNRKTVEENFDNLLTGNQTGNTINKESADNIDDFVNSGSQDSTLDNQGTQKGKRERNEVYKSYYTSLQQLKNIDNYNILEVILQDIQKELCLQVQKY